MQKNALKDTENAREAHAVPQSELIEGLGVDSAVLDGYVRPKTRGELWDLLLAGVPCEVVSTNVEITKSMLIGWLVTMPFTVRPSENVGWSVFESP